MDAAALSSDSGQELARINEQLARLMGGPPARLVAGAEDARQDSLVICGLLGGKDVGKSTLINALAGREISIDREEVGAGTSRPLVYVHRAMVETTRRRLAAVARLDHASLQFFPHEADPIRNIVVVDLPDFDSDFAHHERIAQAVAPHLDRVIWVMTPRKIGDRAWVRFSRDVIKATTNVYFVLNKGDELLADEEGWADASEPRARSRQQADRFCAVQRQWACGVLTETGYDVDPQRVFLIAAEYAEPAVFLQRVGVIWDDPQWQRYRADQEVVSTIGQAFSGELSRLRQTILAPIDEVAAAGIKADNLQAEVRQNVLRLRQHYELEHWTAQLQGALDSDYRQSLLEDGFGVEYRQAVAERLSRLRRTDAELADEVMDVRAGRWPLLRAMYWLSRWAVRRVGRMVSGARFAGGAASIPGDEVFRIRLRGTADRVAMLLDRLRGEHAAAVARLSLSDRLPDAEVLAERMEMQLAALPTAGDAEVVDQLTRSYRVGFLRRCFVWAVLLWFPFVQPVAEGMLEIAAHRGQMLSWLHGLYRVVWALGAGQLLKGFAVVAVIYLVCLAAIYARCIRQVQAARGAGKQGGPESAAGPGGVGGLRDAMSDEIAELASDGVVQPLLAPFEAAAAQLAELSGRLDRLGK